MEWVPYLFTASLAGIMNVIEAWTKFDKKYRFLTFFKPFKSFGFWLWLLVQFLIPICVVWFLFSFSTKPEINWELILKVSVLGSIFISTLNATTEVGILGLNIKPIYDFFTDITYALIASEQDMKTTSFWTNLQQKLNPMIFNDLTCLENYSLNDISLDEQEKEGYQTRIKRIANFQTKDEQIKEIISLLKEVRRNDLPEMLKNLNVEEEFLKQYFPTKYRK